MRTELVERIRGLKKLAGTHSPSIETLLRECGDLKIEVDACFLSNPYATDLFLERLKSDLIDTSKFRDVLEFYPPQNRSVADVISKAIGVSATNIFVGNGAIEIIQAVIHNFLDKSICVILPTFSSYYEFVRPGIDIHYFALKKENDFELDIEEYVSFVKKVKPDTIVLINPNNPNGNYTSKEHLLYILDNLPEVKNVILDESFIHFAYEDLDLKEISSQDLISKYENLVIIKSMSKDFGIAGIRAGYCVMSSDRVDQLLGNGYLWNISGLASYFYNVYAEKSFISEYNIVRKKYIMNTLMFISELRKIPGLKVYSSKANFALVEILNSKSSFDVTMQLLLDHGIYVRDCSDKMGLEGQFIRIASRTFEENLRIIEALKLL